MTTLSGALRRASVFVSAFATLLLLLAPGLPAAAESGAATTAPAAYAGVLRTFNPQMSLVQSKDIATHVLWLSSYYNLDPRLLVAIVGVESSWRSRAVSVTGAQGLGQLMPATAGGLDVLTFDAYENLDGTARYLRRMLQLYPGLSDTARHTRAIASYNAGPEAVARAGGIPPIAETRTYVSRVMALWGRLKFQLPGNATAPPTPAHALARPALAHTRVHHPLRAPDSVADFTQLDLHSMQLLADNEFGSAPIAPKPRGLHSWLVRAFGSAHR